MMTKRNASEQVLELPMLPKLPNISRLVARRWWTNSIKVPGKKGTKYLFHPPCSSTAVPPCIVAYR